MSETLSLRERNRVRTRDEILDSAAILLSDPARFPFTVEELAHDAGVSRGTVYAYFPGGRDEVIQQAYARIAAVARERAELLRSRETLPAERISALARGFLETTAQPTGTFYGAVRPEIAAIAAHHLGGTSSRVAELIEQDLAEARPPVAGSSLLSTLLGGAIGAAGEAAAREPSLVDPLVEAIRALTLSALAPAHALNPPVDEENHAHRNR